MWNTPYGERVLNSAERRLVASEAWALSDAIFEAVALGGSTVEVVLFDRLAWQQQILLIERVLNALTDPNIPAPPTTALLDATVAAIYAQMIISVQLEIDLIDPEDDPNDPYDPYNGFYVRQQVLDAIKEPLDFDELEGDPFEDYSLTVECDEIEEWQMAIESLRGRILADEDWQMEAIVMDLAPATSEDLKQMMGIQGDYFIDIPPDATDEEAEAARLRIAAIGTRIQEEPPL
jgi:hypothetical protein